MCWLDSLASRLISASTSTLIETDDFLGLSMIGGIFAGRDELSEIKRSLKVRKPVIRWSI